jgi:MOSC domain-containing protein YiiM
MTAIIASLSKSGGHTFSKQTATFLDLIEGQGVSGDAHCGTAVKHRSRVAVDPSQPNLRQVHLIAAELLDELNAQGFALEPGDLGENVLTRGLDLLVLPRRTRLRIGSDAEIEMTGLRNPCGQIESFRFGLLAKVAGRDDTGAIVRKAGVMGIVVVGGRIATGDAITVTLPPLPHEPLDRV